MKTNKCIAVLLSLLMGFNTVGVCYAEEVNSEGQEYTSGYIPSDLDYNTPVVNHSSDGISMIDNVVPSSYQTDINYEYIKLDRDKSTFKSHRDFSSEIEITFKHF